MVPDLDLRGNSKVHMEVLAGKNEEISKDAKNNPTIYLNNCEGSCGSEDVEVCVTECTDSTVTAKVQDKSPEATESMSSFGDTISSVENSSMLSDAEVESRLCDRNVCPSVSDEYRGSFLTRRKKLTGHWRRRKKLTGHWRRYIHPIMWRCKWMELKIKELLSQGIKYDRRLAKYDKRKRFDFEQLPLEGFDAKSLPFYNSNQRKKVMKRKKRRRIEEAGDNESYMLQHNLFSYYETKRKPAAYGDSWIDGCGNFDTTVNHNAESLFLELGEDNNPLETTFRQVDSVHSRVHDLKSRIEKVLSENPGKFCSINELSIVPPLDVSYSSGQLATSPKNVSSHGEVILCPRALVSCKNNNVGLVLHNEDAKEEELKAFEKALSRLTEKPLAPTEVEESEKDLGSEVVLVGNEACVSCEQSNGKSHSKPRSKSRSRPSSRWRWNSRK